MDFFVPLLVTFIFGFFGVIGFNHAFKPSRPEDTFLDVMSSYPTIIQIIGELFFALTNKLFPEHIYMKIYRITAFLFGLFMFGIICLFWVILRL